MSERARVIIEQAKLLTLEEREEILDAIAATLDADDANETWQQAWGLEAKRRADEYDANPGEPIDALQAVEDMRQRLKVGRP